jgi:hypothetical protein
MDKQIIISATAVINAVFNAPTTALINAAAAAPTNAPTPDI